MTAEHPDREQVLVAESEAGERLDRLLAARTALSRSRLKALILDGQVAIGSRRTRRASRSRSRWCSRTPTSS
jgi:hypothetical protein